MHPKRDCPPITCAEKLKILSDTTRLGVLEILMDSPKRVSELNAILGIEQSLLSHHLKILRQARFVEATRDGEAVLYRLAPEVVCSSKGIDLGCCLLLFKP